MTLRMTHREDVIEFDEATEIWSCSRLGLSDKSLAKLKKMVDRESKRMRTMRIPALLVYQHYQQEADILEVTIILLREGGRQADVTYTDRHGEDRRSRVDMHALFPLEAREEVIAYSAKRKAADEAEEIAQAAQNKLQESSLTAKRVRELIVQRADEAA